MPQKLINQQSINLRFQEQVYTGDYKMTEPIALEMSLGQFSDCQLYTQKSSNPSDFWLTAALSAVVNASVVEWSDSMLVEYLALANGGDEHRDCVDPDALRLVCKHLADHTKGCPVYNRPPNFQNICWVSKRISPFRVGFRTCCSIDLRF